MYRELSKRQTQSARLAQSLQHETLKRQTREGRLAGRCADAQQGEMTSTGGLGPTT